MQINQLPTIPQAPANADVLAIEVNGITYKVSKQALAEAIAANITPADIGALPSSTTFVSGVKGSKESSYRSGNVNLTPANIGALPDTTTAEDIEAAAIIMLSSSDTTPSVIYNKVNVLGYAKRAGALIYIDKAALNVLTNRTDFTTNYSGLITHSATNQYRFMLMNAGINIMCFYANITSSTITTGPIYQYNGTQMS